MKAYKNKTTLKIAVYGDAYGPFPEKVVRNAREIGRQIALGGHILITGGCEGLPNEAVSGASSLGGKCMGFSPAINLQMHVQKYKMPTTGFTEFVFVPRSYPLVNNPLVCKKYRNISSCATADIGIIVGGRIGTMNEFTLMYDFGKIIGVLEGSGGITKSAIKRLIQESNKKTGAKVIFDKDPLSLVKKLVAFSSQQ